MLKKIIILFALMCMISINSCTNDDGNNNLTNPSKSSKAFIKIINKSTMGIGKVVLRKTDGGQDVLMNGSGMAQIFSYGYTVFETKPCTCTVYLEGIYFDSFNNTLTLQSGIKILKAGDTCTLVITASFTDSTEADTVKPAVNLISPSKWEYEDFINYRNGLDSFVISFSEQIDSSALKKNGIYLTDNTSMQNITLNYTESAYLGFPQFRCVIKPVSPLKPFCVYKLVISDNVKDLGGNSATTDTFEIAVNPVITDTLSSISQYYNLLFAKNGSLTYSDNSSITTISSDKSVQWTVSNSSRSIYSGGNYICAIDRSKSPSTLYIYSSEGVLLHTLDSLTFYGDVCLTSNSFLYGMITKNNSSFITKIDLSNGQVTGSAEIGRGKLISMHNGVLGFKNSAVYALYSSAEITNQSLYADSYLQVTCFDSNLTAKWNRSFPGIIYSNSDFYENINYCCVGKNGELIINNSDLIGISPDGTINFTLELNKNFPFSPPVITEDNSILIGTDSTNFGVRILLVDQTGTIKWSKGLYCNSGDYIGKGQFTILPNGFYLLTIKNKIFYLDSNGRAIGTTDFYFPLRGGCSPLFTDSLIYINTSPVIRCPLPVSGNTVSFWSTYGGGSERDFCAQ